MKMEQNKKDTFSLADITQTSTLTTNVQQDCIVTTYDKIKLTLIEYEDNKKYAQNWWSYLSIAISFILPCFTADFKPFLFFSAEFLKTFFEVIATISVIVTIFSIWKRIRNRKKITIEYCVNQIKNNV
mgnify:CR=1 FL=1